MDHPWILFMGKWDDPWVLDKDGELILTLVDFL